MLFLLLVIGIALLVLGILMNTLRFFTRKDMEVFGAFIGCTGGIIAVITFIATLVVGVDVSNLSVIDEKIEMYQEENKNIEEQMDILVKQYMDYESDTLSEFKSESSVTLVSMYPELKSDTLVEQQLTTYIENNNNIKNLKAKKIDGSVLRWWLYFGK